MVTQVEALEARRVIEFALEMGTTQATFEGDSDIIFMDLTKSLTFFSFIWAFDS